MLIVDYIKDFFVCPYCSKPIIKRTDIIYKLKEGKAVCEYCRADIFPIMEESHKEFHSLFNNLFPKDNEEAQKRKESFGIDSEEILFFGQNRESAIKAMGWMIEKAIKDGTIADKTQIIIEYDPANPLFCVHTMRKNNIGRG